MNDSATFNTDHPAITQKPWDTQIMVDASTVNRPGTMTLGALAAGLVDQSAGRRGDRHPGSSASSAAAHCQWASTQAATCSSVIGRIDGFTASACRQMRSVIAEPAVRYC